MHVRSLFSTLFDGLMFVACYKSVDGGNAQIKLLKCTCKFYTHSLHTHTHV